MRFYLRYEGGLWNANPRCTPGVPPSADKLLASRAGRITFLPLRPMLPRAGEGYALADSPGCQSAFPHPRPDRMSPGHGNDSIAPLYSRKSISGGLTELSAAGFPWAWLRSTNVHEVVTLR